MHLISQPHDHTLSHLFQHRVFHSRRKLDTHIHVAQELSDHVLVWNGNAVDTAMYSVRVDRCQVIFLKYGAEVVVRPRPFDDFSLIHVSLRGAAEIETPSHKVVIKEGMAAHIASRRNVRLRWQEGSEQLILKIPNSVWDDARCFLRQDLSIAMLPPVALLSVPASVHLKQLISSLVSTSGLMSNGLDLSNYSWVTHTEANVALFVASQILPPLRDNSAQSQLNSNHAKSQVCYENPQQEKIERLLDFMRSSLDTQFSLTQLADAIGISTRSLNMMCNQLRGESPMDMLRSIRLEQARELLLSNPHTNVADVAVEVGFSNSGRFSGYYRERFKETPKETQKKARAITLVV